MLLPLMASGAAGGSYATVLLADIFVAALFASSLHFILGPGGMHSFGHAVPMPSAIHSFVHVKGS